MPEARAEPLWWGPGGLWHAGAAGTASRWDGLEAWCAAHPGRSARLWLSSWWVLDVRVDDDLPLHGDAALLDHVRPLLQHYHGEAAAAWPLAAWQAGGARGASALHGLSLATLTEAAAGHGVMLRCVQPWWARALPLALAQAPALARAATAELLLLEGRLLTRLTLQRGVLAGLQQRRLAEASPAGLRDWLAAELVPPPSGPVALIGHGLLAGADAGAGAPPPGPPDTAPARPLPDRSGACALDGLHPPLAWWAGATPARAPRAPGAAVAPALARAGR